MKTSIIRSLVTCVTATTQKPRKLSTRSPIGAWLRVAQPPLSILPLKNKILVAKSFRLTLQEIFAGVVHCNRRTGVGVKISVILSCMVSFLRQYRLRKRLPEKLKLKPIIST